MGDPERGAAGRDLAERSAWRSLRGRAGRYVLYQHHHCQVNRASLHEQLREWGIDTFVRQIDALLGGDTGELLAEKNQLLTSALAVSRWITVDDTGARHQGHNGDVTRSATTGSPGLPARTARARSTP